jgi:hypothetical protein
VLRSASRARQPWPGLGHFSNARALRPSLISLLSCLLHATYNHHHHIHSYPFASPIIDTLPASCFYIACEPVSVGDVSVETSLPDIWSPSRGSTSSPHLPRAFPSPHPPQPPSHPLVFASQSLHPPRSCLRIPFDSQVRSCPLAVRSRRRIAQFGICLGSLQVRFPLLSPHPRRLCPGFRSCSPIVCRRSDR